MKERHIIAAVADGGAIGYNGDLIYRISADLKHFKELTIGNVVIMGRKTFESIGKPLPSRDNIVVTSRDLNIDGIHCVKSLDAAYELAETLDGQKIFVIGGGQLYKDALAHTDILDITEIFELPHYADTFFPTDLSDFLPVHRSERYWNDTTPVIRFVTYKRKDKIFR